MSSTDPKNPSPRPSPPHATRGRGREDDARFPLRTVAWAVLLVCGLFVWMLYVMGSQSARAWRALLVNFALFTPMAAGLVTWSAVVTCARGHWSGRLERLNLAGLSFAPASLLALVALCIGAGTWAPWARQTPHQGAWLSPAAVFSRDIVMLAAFWMLAWHYARRRTRGAGKVAGAFTIVGYCATFTLLSFDLVMALDPEWSSEIFGAYFFVSGMYSGVTLWTFLACFSPDATADRRHDLAKLMVAFSILTFYTAYAQLLVIYYENIPAETRFWVPRFNLAPWKWVSVFIAGLVYLGPLVILLTVKAKRSRSFLRAFALAVLLGTWVERWWLVEPAFVPHRLPIGPAELSISAAFLGAFGLGFDLVKRHLPEDLPEEEESEIITLGT